MSWVELTRSRRFRFTATAGAFAVLGVLAGCGGEGAGPAAEAEAEAEGCDGMIEEPVELEVWFHTGNEKAQQQFTTWVDGFNESGVENVTANLVQLPEGNYNDQVQAAAAAGQLPDVLDFDGPNLYNYAWNNNLIPLDDCLSDEVEANLLPTIIDQGTYAGNLYGVGYGESGMALYVRKSAMEEIGARIPEGPDDAWTAQEVTDMLPALQAAGYETPINLGMEDNQSEWYAYAFSTIVWSAGGDLIDRESGQTADGQLNSPEVVEAMELFQSWFEDGYVDTNVDKAAFESGRSAISWTGHWGWPLYTDPEAVSYPVDDVVIVPLPDWGAGTKTGSGSWQWGATTSVEDPDAAAAFINYMLSTEQQEEVETYGGVPANAEALAQIEDFAPGGPRHLFLEQLESGVATPRPQTPAYPVISSQFRQAVTTIMEGGDVSEALDGAVDAIDQDIEDNDGYPPIED